MDDLEYISEKAKGKVEEIKGEVNQQAGKGLKGGAQKLKGKARQKIADVKMNTKKAHRVNAKGDEDWDKDEDW